MTYVRDDVHDKWTVSGSFESTFLSAQLFDKITRPSQERAPLKIVLVVDFKGFNPLEITSTAVHAVGTAIKTDTVQGSPPNVNGH